MTSNLLKKSWYHFCFKIPPVGFRIKVKIILLNFMRWLWFFSICSLFCEHTLSENGFRLCNKNTWLFKQVKGQENVCIKLCHSSRKKPQEVVFLCFLEKKVLYTSCSWYIVWRLWKHRHHYHTKTFPEKKNKHTHTSLHPLLKSRVQLPQMFKLIFTNWHLKLPELTFTTSHNKTE